MGEFAAPVVPVISRGPLFGAVPFTVQLIELPAGNPEAGKVVGLHDVVPKELVQVGFSAGAGPLFVQVKVPETGLPLIVGVVGKPLKLGLMPLPCTLMLTLAVLQALGLLRVQIW